MLLYKITNIVNGKVYIGKTERSSVQARWKEHLRKLKYGSHVNKHLLSAYKKYGYHAFTFEVIYKTDDLAMLNEEEKRMIEISKAYNPDFGYNKTLGGDGGTPSEETRKKLSHSLKGRKFSNDHIQKLKNSRRGIRLSDEAKKKLSTFWTGSKRPKSKKHKEKLRITLLGNNNANRKVKETEYIRVCSVCGDKIYHENANALRKAIKRTSLCRSCSSKRRENERSRKRQ